MGGRALIVLDTHVWVWWNSDPKRLSERAREAMDSSADLGVSAISAWEVTTKLRRGRIDLDRDVDVWIAQALGSERVVPLPVTPKIAAAAGLLDEGFHGDPADRIIVATALSNGCPIVTKDKRIRLYKEVVSIW